MISFFCLFLLAFRVDSFVIKSRFQESQLAPAAIYVYGIFFQSNVWIASSFMDKERS